MGSSKSKVAADDVQPAEQVGVMSDSKRHCTDCLCILVFALFWVVMLIIAVLGIANGNPERLVYGTDYAGNVCSGGKPVTYYPRLNEDLMLAASNALGSGSVNLASVKLFGVCLSECPLRGDVVCTYGGDYGGDQIPNYADDSGCASSRCGASHAQFPAATDVAQCTTDPAFRFNNLRMCRSCWLVPLNSTRILNRCIFEYKRETTVLCRRCTSPASFCTPDSHWCREEHSQQYNASCVPTDEHKTFVNPDSNQCMSKETITESRRDELAQPNPLIEKFNRAAAVISRWFTDLKNAALVVFVVGVACSVAFGFVFVFLLKYLAGVIVWTTIFLFQILLIVVTILLYLKAGVIGQDHIDYLPSAVEVPSQLDASENNAKYFKWAAYVFTALSLLCLILIVAMARRVRVAVAVIKEASRAVQRIPTMVFFPVTTVASITALALYWVYIAAYIASSDSISTASLSSGMQSMAARAGAGNLLFSSFCSNDTSAEGGNVTCALPYEALADYDQSWVVRGMLAVHLLGFLWTSQLFQAVAMCTIAGAVCSFYWTPAVDGKKHLGRFPLLASFRRAVRYHLGSLIFGSLVIAIVQLLRIILAYVDRKTKNLQQRNGLVKMLFKVVQCCLWCFEKIIKFISRNAYIMIAMRGHSFCRASFAAVHLILANGTRVLVLSLVSNFVLLLGKLTITVTCGIVAYLWMERGAEFGKGGDKELSGRFVPVLVTMLFAYYVATGFMAVYDLAIDTIFLCFCEDLSVNDGESRPYAMNPRLLSIVGRSNAAPKDGGSSEVQLVQRAAAAGSDNRTDTGLM